jgi:hypothetical protein
LQQAFEKRMFLLPLASRAALDIPNLLALVHVGRGSWLTGEGVWVFDLWFAFLFRLLLFSLLGGASIYLWI